CADGAGRIRTRAAGDRGELAEDQVPRAARARAAGVPEAARRLSVQGVAIATVSRSSSCSIRAWVAVTLLTQVCGPVPGGSDRLTASSTAPQTSSALRADA